MTCTINIGCCVSRGRQMRPRRLDGDRPLGSMYYSCVSYVALSKLGSGQPSAEMQSVM